MEKIKKALPFALVLILNFYLLPLLIKDTGPAKLMLMGITDSYDNSVAALLLQKRR